MAIWKWTLPLSAWVWGCASPPASASATRDGVRAAEESRASEPATSLSDAGPPQVRIDAPPLADAAPLDAARGPAVRPERVLVDHARWHVYDAALDPLRSHQPAEIDCAKGWSTQATGPTLDVETGDCNYALLAHPVAADVEAGERLSARFWHFDLVAREPAEAHLALLLEDEVLWETRLSIPREAAALEVQARAPRAIAKGELLRIHLHNHGENSYVLSAVVAGGEQE